MKRHSMQGWLASLGLALMSTAGCAVVDTINPLSSPSSKAISPQELTARLRALGIMALSHVERASRGIDESRPDLLRQATLLKIDIAAFFRREIEARAPLQTLLLVWPASLAMSKFFLEGEGREAFGVATPAMGQAFATVAREAVTIAAEVLPPDALQRAQQDIETFVRENPLGKDQMSTARLSLVIKPESEGYFASVFNLPTRLLPMATGVDATAQAIEKVAAAAEHATWIVSQVPLETSWRTEILLQDLDRVQTLQKALGEVAALNANIERIATTTTELPAQVRGELGRALEDVDARQENLQKTLHETQALMTQLDGTLGNVGSVLQQVDGITKGLEATGKAWEPVAREVGKIVGGDGNAPPPSPTDPPSRPFDIREFAQTADALTRTAGELRGLLGDLHGMLGSDDLPRTLVNVDTTARSTVDHATARTIDLTDHLFWRAIALVGVLLGAAIAYRLATHRLARRGQRA